MKTTIFAIATVLCLLGLIGATYLSLESPGINGWTAIAWINVAGVLANGRSLLNTLFPLPTR